MTVNKAICAFRLWASVIVLVNTVVVTTVRSTAVLKGNAYEDVPVALPSGLKLRDAGKFFNGLETLLRRASRKLFAATDHRWYFGGVRVLLPLDIEAPRSLLVRNATWELLSDPDIVIEKRHGLEARAHQSRGCGKPGDSVLLPVGSVSSEDIDAAARSLVQRWAQVRYGVFEETAWDKDHQLCYKDGHVWRPTGCYTADATVQRLAGIDGRPYCTSKDVDMQSIFEGAAGITSSLLFTSREDKVERFCDSSGDHLHRPSAPTIHNLVCDSRSAWDVIRASDDYMTQCDPLEMLPATSFDYVRQRDHLYVYLIQTCSPDNEPYKDVMVAVNEGFRRFIAFNGPEKRRWRLALFSGRTIEILNEFRQNDTWRRYLTNLDRTVRSNCYGPGTENLFKDAIELPSDVPTTMVALLHGSTASAQVVQELQALGPVRLSVVLFGALGGPSDTWKNAPAKTKLYVIPSRLDKEAMAALIDLALFNIHHKTAALYGDTIKVFQETSIKLDDGAAGTFSVEPSAEGTLSFIVACPDIYNIEDSHVRLNGERLASYRVKMSMFAVQKAVKSTSATTWSYAVDPTRSDQRCSLMASLRYPANEDHITLRGWLDRSTVYPSADDAPQALFAELRHGNTNVTNVTMQAFLYASDTTTTQPITAELKDDGLLEPDISRDDGIYSAHFTHVTKSPTWYTVIVRATGILSENSANGQGSVEERAARTTRRFYREELVGSFWSAAWTHDGSALPPQKTYDLEATVISYPNVTLTWTAARGYSSKNASKSFYQIRYSGSLGDLLNRDSFAALQGWDVASTAKPGHPESFDVKLPQTSLVDTAYYVALRTVNRVNRPSRISNIVHVAPDLQEATTIVPPSPSGRTVPAGNTGASTVASRSAQQADLSQTTVRQRTDLPLPTAVPPSDVRLLYAGRFTKQQFYWMVGGVATAFILVVIIINCLVCLLCLKRDKTGREQKPVKEQQPEDVGTATEPQDIQVIQKDAELRLSLATESLEKDPNFGSEKTLVFDVHPSTDPFDSRSPCKDDEETSCCADETQKGGLSLPVSSVNSQGLRAEHEDDRNEENDIEKQNLRCLSVKYGIPTRGVQPFTRAVPLHVRKPARARGLTSSANVTPRPLPRSKPGGTKVPRGSDGKVLARTSSGIYYNLGYV